jgi:hypothetical protein
MQPFYVCNGCNHLAIFKYTTLNLYKIKNIVIQFVTIVYVLVNTMGCLILKLQTCNCPALAFGLYPGQMCPQNLEEFWYSVEKDGML